MSPYSRPSERAVHFADSTTGTIPFVLALAVFLVVFLLGPARTANAQEAAGRETSETTAGMPEGVEVGDGEVSINGGDVYAGNGCAKAGDVVAGDCDGKGGKNDEATSSSDTASPEGIQQENTSEENTVLIGETAGLETTGFETTGFETNSPEATSELTAPEETATQEQEDLCPAEPSGKAVEATVARAVDGDTLELTEEAGGKDRVRLVGVDAPELKGEDGEPEPYAEEAATFTAETLEGEKVLLEIGEEETDEYGRLLANVWTAPEDGIVGGLKRMVGVDDSELFNRTLLGEGYAEVLTIEPNDLYAGCFDALERAARDEEAGIWGTGGGSSDEQYDGETEPLQTIPEMTVERTLPEDSVLDRNTGAETVPVEEGGPPVDRGPQEPSAQDQYADTDDGPVAVPEPPAEQPTDETAPAPEHGDRDDLDPLPATPEPAESAPPASAPPLEPATPSSSTASPAPKDVGLPTRDTPDGSVAVLPETGGPSPAPIAGAFLICCGVGLLAASRRRPAGLRRG